MPLVFRYAFFCLIGSSINLTVQWICSRAFSAPLWVALAAGTAAGLVPKYILDRNFIFEGHGATFREDTRRFFFYASFGLVTTLIFWGIEWSATLVSSHPAAQYVGGAVGLAITYTMKYLMDRKWVFGSSTLP